MQRVNMFCAKKSDCPFSPMQKVSNFYWKNYQSLHSCKTLLKVFDNEPPVDSRREEFLSTFMKQTPLFRTSHLKHRFLAQTPQHSLFVAFLNVLFIHDSLDVAKSSSSKVSWDVIWNKVQKENIDDMAFLLDALHKNKLLEDTLMQRIQYTCVRNASDHLNVAFAQDAHGALNNIEKFMKRLLQKSPIIVVLKDNDARVCIGYTLTEWVFVDSTNSDSSSSYYHEDAQGRTVNRFDTGFSFAPISLIVSHVKEILYLSKKQIFVKPSADLYAPREDNAPRSFKSSR